MRAAGLVCLGAGAGLIRGDLRDVRGTDVACRSGGVVVTVRGARPRTVPVLARYHARLLAAARFAGTGLICGGIDPGPPEHHEPADQRAGRRHRAAAAGHLPAAGDLAGRLRGAARAGHVHARGRDQLLPAARRPDRRAGAGRRGRGGAAARGGPAVMIPLAAFEEIIDASGVAPRIEAMLPIGVRPRQLSVRTLLAGMCLTQADRRPAHLTRVHQALTSLPEDDQRPARRDRGLETRAAPAHLPADRAHLRPGRGRRSPRTSPAGCPPASLQGICDDLLEASIPEQFKNASTSLAVDWTDLESFSRPPPHGTSDCADPEASWGHRKNNLLRSQDELFYGYYLSAGVMMPEENGPAVPELARRATMSSCRHDPVRAFAPVLTAMPGQGIPLGDILDDSGYAHRDAGAWAIPLRAAGAAARPGPAPARPRPQGHPPRRHHQPTATCTAPRHRARCWSSGRSPAPPPGNKPRTTTARPPSSPATSSAASPATTQTATTACSAPPPWARSAARSAPPR